MVPFPPFSSSRAVLSTLCFRHTMPPLSQTYTPCLCRQARYPRGFALVRDGQEPVILVAETDTDFHRLVQVSDWRSPALDAKILCLFHDIRLLSFAYDLRKASAQGSP